MILLKIQLKLKSGLKGKIKNQKSQILNNQNLAMTKIRGERFSAIESPKGRFFGRMNKVEARAGAKGKG